MALRLVRPKEYRYILEREKESDNPTIFWIRPLPAGVVAKVQDEYTTYEASTSELQAFASEEGGGTVRIHSRTNERDILIFRIGVSRVENLLDEEGKVIETPAKETIQIYGKKYEALPLSFVDLFPLDVITEVARVLLEGSKFGEDDQKK